ncbi:hypothetical protein Tco_0514496 [Tanacetum coccineum]
MSVYSSMKGKQPNKLAIKTSNNFPETQNGAICEPFDNVLIDHGSACDIPSVEAGMGVSVVPFEHPHVYRGCSASEGMCHLSGSPYATEELPSSSCHSQRARLYLDVFQKYSEFYGGTFGRQCSTSLKGIFGIIRCEKSEAESFM